ncbi:MAG TPA: hypothetical protein VGQ52_19125 [Gemmatimonadaceae bacterium]|nr:hypothetical protein [Gemmatimonadaceae bacterium]
MRPICIAIMAALTPALLLAQDSALTRILIANRHAIRLSGGRLDGRGGRMLVDEGKSARFFLVGEEHGVAQTPAIVQALLSELRPAGYNTFAIEVSPLQGQRLDAIARGPRATERLDSLMATWFSAVPFYTLAEERSLLASAMTAQESLAPMRIWGLDYDVSADRLFLRELEALAPPSGRAAVQRARALADSGFAAVSRPGRPDPSKLFAWSAPDSIFTALRAALGSKPPARGSAIIDAFERTARINRLFLSGRVYESNLMRSGYLRENFTKHFATASRGGVTPRVLFKFGGSHMMRGWNYTHTLDIGTAATIIAESRGERSFNVLILGGPGSKSTRMNIMSLQYDALGDAEIEDDNVAWLRPAVADSGWSLFDMRAVRLDYVKRRAQALTPVQDRFLHAYDAIVVLKGSTPGTARRLDVR